MRTIVPEGYISVMDKSLTEIRLIQEHLHEVVKYSGDKDIWIDRSKNVLGMKAISDMSVYMERVIKTAVAACYTPHMFAGMGPGMWTCAIWDEICLIWEKHALPRYNHFTGEHEAAENLSEGKVWVKSVLNQTIESMTQLCDLYPKTLEYVVKYQDVDKAIKNRAIDCYERTVIDVMHELLELLGIVGYVAFRSEEFIEAWNEDGDFWTEYVGLLNSFWHNTIKSVSKVRREECGSGPFNRELDGFMESTRELIKQYGAYK